MSKMFEVQKMTPELKREIEEAAKRYATCEGLKTIANDHETEIVYQREKHGFKSGAQQFYAKGREDERKRASEVIEALEAVIRTSKDTGKLNCFAMNELDIALEKYRGET